MNEYQKFIDLLEQLTPEQREKMYTIMKLIVESTTDKEE